MNSGESATDSCDVGNKATDSCTTSKQASPMSSSTSTGNVNLNVNNNSSVKPMQQEKPSCSNQNFNSNLPQGPRNNDKHHNSMNHPNANVQTGRFGTGMTGGGQTQKLKNIGPNNHRKHHGHQPISHPNNNNNQHHHNRNSVNHFVPNDNNNSFNSSHNQGNQFHGRRRNNDHNARPLPMMSAPHNSISHPSFPPPPPPFPRKSLGPPDNLQMNPLHNGPTNFQLDTNNNKRQQQSQHPNNHFLGPNPGPIMNTQHVPPPPPPPPPPPRAPSSNAIMNTMQNHNYHSHSFNPTSSNIPPFANNVNNNNNNINVPIMRPPPPPPPPKHHHHQQQMIVHPPYYPQQHQQNNSNHTPHITTPFAPNTQPIVQLNSQSTQPMYISNPMMSQTTSNNSIPFHAPPMIPSSSTMQQQFHLHGSQVLANPNMATSTTQSPSIPSVVAPPVQHPNFTTSHAPQLNTTVLQSNPYQSQPNSTSLTTTSSSNSISNNANVNNLTSPDNIASNWSTHVSPTGANYYYNAVSKISTYTKPSCLQSDNDNTKNTSLKQDTNVASSKKPDSKKKQVWTEYTDPKSGKKYYYDGVTTTWDKPPNFESSSSSTKRKDADEKTTNTNHKKSKQDHISSTTQQYKSKAEAVLAFKGLLLAKDVTPTMKWNDVVKLCGSDPRWEACSTAGERKQALAEFQTKRAAELREFKRQEKIRAKDSFNSLLTEVLPTIKNFNVNISSTNNIGFSNVREFLSRDDRFYVVDEEDAREELFYDFCEELRKREERKRRGRKRDAKDALIAFLKEKEENGNLTFASTWSSFLSSLDDKDKLDGRLLTSAAMSDSDRQLYFADYVIELQALEDEKRRRIRDAKLRAEKAQRDAYRETLRSLSVEGRILPSTRWRNLEDYLSSHVTFGPVSEQDKDAPRDMFEDFVDEWAESYRRDKALLLHLCSCAESITVSEETTFDDFTKALLDAAAYSQDVYSDTRRLLNSDDPISSAKLYFDEMKLKIRDDDEKAQLLYKNALGRHRNHGDLAESSEDEGEIVEEAEEET